MRKRRRTGAMSGDVHRSSQDLVQDAAEKLKNMRSLEDIDRVKTMLDRVQERESSAENVVTFIRHT